ncbi:hypothetical protein [Slackia faecicanis]|uniref:hypothetical protein n=1 Tax=Slackia faecicanis TaxID=255723 RepID=UPI0011CD8D6D|nr:hypothetical protein [Slackia faecicanis]
MENLLQYGFGNPMFFTFQYLNGSKSVVSGIKSEVFNIFQASAENRMALRRFIQLLHARAYGTNGVQ